jgi:hypothetical protein
LLSAGGRAGASEWSPEELVESWTLLGDDWERVTRRLLDRTPAPDPSSTQLIPVAD